MHFLLWLKSLVSSFKEQEDYEGFKLACIVNFGIDTSITEEEFKKEMQQYIDRSVVYMKPLKITSAIKKNVSKQAVPVFKNIRQTQGQHIENVVVPFTDGRKGINVLTNLDKTLATEGEELSNALERNITLGYY